MSIKKQTGLFTYQNQRFTSYKRDQAPLTKKKAVSDITTSSDKQV